ncbi:MAG: HAD-IA family hydrolase [Alphaproteobacteria bacterium]
MIKKIKNLVFDLDYTLYPSSTNIERLFKEKAVQYLHREMKLSPEEIENAFDVFKKNASILRGAREMGLDIETFFDYICDVDISAISYNHPLREVLLKLPHKKVIYTNSSRKHTDEVLKKLKIEDLFQHKFTAEDSQYHFKPETESFDKFFEEYKITPHESAFFEDNLRNLEKAKSLGMTTVFISAEKKEAPHFCDYVFEDINQALNLFQ